MCVGDGGSELDLMLDGEDEGHAGTGGKGAVDYGEVMAFEEVGVVVGVGEVEVDAKSTKGRLEGLEDWVRVRVDPGDAMSVGIEGGGNDFEDCDEDVV